MTRTNLTEIKAGMEGTGLLIENDGYVWLHEARNKPILEQISTDENGRLNIPNPFVLNAVFQKYDIENGNGRVYPEHILRNAVEKYMSHVRDNHAYGECNHPDNTSVDLGRIALNIIELHWEGQTLVGKLVIPITPGYRNFGVISCFADMVAHWILSGLKVGVSSRGLGSVKNTMGRLVVDDDYEIVCWDFVSQPSTPNAWVANDYEGLRTYIESDESKKNKPVINENKYKKFENWLLKG